ERPLRCPPRFGGARGGGPARAPVSLGRARVLRSRRSNCRRSKNAAARICRGIRAPIARRGRRATRPERFAASRLYGRLRPRRRELSDQKARTTNAPVPLAPEWPARGRGGGP